MRDTEPADVPKFLIDNARNDSKTNRPALVRLERAIADIATENTNMGIERSQSEFAPKLTARDLDRADTSRPPAQSETAEQAVAGWVIGMPYTDPEADLLRPRAPGQGQAADDLSGFRGALAFLGGERGRPAGEVISAMAGNERC
jgi:hypothetical protein